MTTFARMQAGVPVEVFPPVTRTGEGGQIIEVPIAERFAPEFVSQLVEVPDGTQPEPVPLAPTIPPRIVTMRQARLALLQAGMLQAVSGAIAQLPSPQKEAAQIEWEFASVVDRDSEFLQSLAGVLGLDDPALDALFEQAGTL